MSIATIYKPKDIYRYCRQLVGWKKDSIEINK